MDKGDEMLSPAQVVVLGCLAKGMKRDAIASALPAEFRVGVNGVIYHLKEIYRKLGVNSAPEAVAEGIRRKLI